MLKVMIVDDEKLVIQALSKIVNRTNFAKVIADAENGMLAISKAQELLPDVIFMDVHMPEMNGLTTLRKIRENLQEASFIILSAYDAFEYAQQAIDLKVFSYLLKPIEPDKVIMILQKLYDLACNKEAAQISAKLHAETNAILNTYFMQSILDLQKHEELDLNLLKFRYSRLDYFFKVAVVKFTFDQLGLDILKNAIQAINSIRNNFKIVAYTLNQENHLTILMESQEPSCFDEGYPNNQNPFDDLLTVLEEVTGQKVLVGIGQSYKGLSNAKKSYFEALEALRLGSNKLNYFNISLNTINESQLEIYKNSLEYIENNYCEEISLKDIAEYVHLSLPHFSRLFKKITGKTFQVYLKEKRLEKAKMILKSSGTSLELVAQACGYSDSSYFCRVFKKEYGLTPMEFRRKEQNEL